MSETGSQPNEETDLLSGLIRPNPKQCLSFWYHKYGEHINTLKVFKLNDNRTVELWNASANQGNKWYFQSLSLNDNGPYRIVFKAIRGNGSNSEIAIDDISITNTDCKKAFILDCNFEAEKCNWFASSEMPYIWTTKIPGDNKLRPANDHTIGTVDGRYINLQVTDYAISIGMNSTLTSTIIEPDGDVCFTFWYYMGAPDVGNLSVYTDSGSIIQLLWSQTGNNERTWKFANLTISELKPYKIIFKGVRGTGYWSVIALDDISVLNRSCSGLIKTSRKCQKINESISLHECSKYYLQLKNTSLVFDPEAYNCSTVYQDIQTSVATFCNNKNNSDICTFDLPELVKEDHSHRCFQSNWLSVEYRCEVEVPSTSKSSSEVEDTTTVALDFTSRDDSSAETTVSLLLTSEALSQVVETTVPVLSTSDAVSQGLIVGLVIGSFVLVFIVAVICLIRRFLMEKYNLEKIENIQGNEYTGHQTIALQQSSIPPHYEVVQNTNNQYAFTNIAMTNSYEIINNVKFDDERKQIAPLENETGSKIETKVNQYDVIDPTVITSSCRSTEDKSVDTENQTVFIQNETELDQSKISDKPQSHDVTRTIIVVEPHACAGFHSRDDETVVTKSEAGSKHIVPLEDESKEKFATKGNQYEEIDPTAIDPTAITSVCLSTEDNPRETENNTVFDQKRTEFDPSKLSDKTQSCDLTRTINEEQDNLIMSKVGPNKCASGQLRDDKTVVTETDDESKHSTPPEDDTTKGKFEIKGNQYEEIDNIANISVWHSTEDKPSVINNYTVLDPKETGFDRSKIINNKQSYELAKPVRAENDEYGMSKDGTYDCAGRSNHKDVENIYNRAVDNVYDSGSHKRKDFGNENAYDHFVRQKDGR